MSDSYVYSDKDRDEDFPPMPDHPMSDEERVAKAIADTARPWASFSATLVLELAQAAIAALGPQLTAEEAERVGRTLWARHTVECEDHALATHDQEPCICGLDDLRAKLSLIAKGGEPGA